MKRWAKTVLDRNQILLFPPKLDERIPEDHPVRLFDEILASRDWSGWERRYQGRRGQPPIHPSVLASAILYGLSKGVRSSRMLEDACANRLDFIWLVGDRRIDHSTFCNFRNGFEEELKDLFRQIGRMAMKMGLVRLNRVSLDGTRVRASSSRYGTKSAERIRQSLAALDHQIDELFSQAHAADEREDDFYGEGHTPNSLPQRLAKAQKRREMLQQALANAEARDAEQHKQKGDKARAAKAPVADPESVVMPNKDGGQAPNYTPIATVDSEAGLIVDADVRAQPTEDGAAPEAVDRIEESFGHKPKQLLADKHHGSGATLSALKQRQVEAFIPIPDRNDTAENPARRPHPTRPVGQDQWAKLPRGKHGKLDRSAFIYQEDGDCYWCPMGRKLRFWHVQKKKRLNGPDVTVRKYRSNSCEGCPLAGECLQKVKGVRTVGHDQYEKLRLAAEERLGSPEGKKTFSTRKHLSETPFALIKTAMGLRQFSTRGLRKVKNEWLWACTAYDVRKLAYALSARRQCPSPA